MKQDEAPRIKLEPLPYGVVVRVQTEREYRTLRRVCERGGWNWIMGEAATDATKDNLFARYKDQTCLTADGILRYGSISDPWLRGGDILSLEDFLEIEEIARREVGVVNRYFNRIAKSSN